MAPIHAARLPRRDGAFRWREIFQRLSIRDTSSLSDPSHFYFAEQSMTFELHEAACR